MGRLSCSTWIVCRSLSRAEKQQDIEPRNDTICILLPFESGRWANSESTQGPAGCGDVGNVRQAHALRWYFRRFREGQQGLELIALAEAKVTRQYQVYLVRSHGGRAHDPSYFCTLIMIYWNRNANSTFKEYVFAVE